MPVNCSQSIEDSWHARGAAGVTCLLVTLIFLCELLCDHRAYKTTLQRLVLFYTILSFLYHVLNSVNGLVHNHSPPSPGNLTLFENAAMYFANAAFILPAIIINYVMYLILQLCCGFHMRHPQSKPSTFITDLVCFVLAVLFSLIPWLPANFAAGFKHFSFDVFYTVYASGCQTNNISDVESVIAVAVSAVIIIEMFVAVTVLNIVHRRVRLQIRGQQVLALERRTHVIVIAVALIYAIGIILSFPFCLLEVEEHIDWNASEIFLAIWFPILNQCNLFVMYVASVRTTNHPLFCLQRKKPQASDRTDKRHLTNPSSHPFSQPTHTTWHQPYTNGFTKITETSGVYCDNTSSNTEEMQSLLKAGKFEPPTYSALTDSAI